MDFSAHDFLDYTSSEPFDVIFDYLFLSAIPTKDRRRWSTACARLLKPGGLLVAIIYPVGVKNVGPPFEMSEQEYVFFRETNF